MAKITKKEKQIENFLKPVTRHISSGDVSHERQIKKSVAAVIANPQPKPRLNQESKMKKICSRFRVSSGYFTKKKVIQAGFFLIVAGLLGTSVYFYHQYKKATAVDASKNEAAGYVTTISKFMILPADETPTMATVADSSKLSSQPFFANAQNGDKVLFYTKAQKAILYRPSTNMIVEAASMAGASPEASTQNTSTSPNTQSVDNAAQSQNEPQAQSQPTADTQNSSADVATAPKTAKVAIYNGTQQKGLAKSVSERLSAVSQANVVSTTNAKGNFAKTVVIDLTGNNSDVAQKIAGTLNGEIGSLPDGEIKPDADILIIAGNDVVSGQ